MRTELHVPSDLKFMNIVESWLLGSLQAELGESVDWAKHSQRLRLVLVEAYSNVVRHAHKDQPNLPVLMRLELKDRDIRLEIWDYGRGYDLSTYLPPNPQDLQENGYGWLILNRLMDKVEYRLQVNGRNCLKLESTIPDQDFKDINLSAKVSSHEKGSSYDKEVDSAKSIHHEGTEEFEQDFDSSRSNDPASFNTKSRADYS